MKTCLHRFFGIKKKVSQKVKLSNLYLFGIMILALFTLIGCGPFATCSKCMTSPYDNELGWSGPIDYKNYFSGQVPSPNEVVKINAYNWNTNKWEEIGSTTSIYSQFGPPYHWFVWLPVLGQYWKPQLLPAPHCATAQYYARVKALTDTEGTLDTLIENWGDCSKSHPNDFESYCLTPDHEAQLQSILYDFGTYCADQINKIRAKEGKQPLLIDEAGECGADNDAKCNYEWEKDNCVAGYPMCSQQCNQCSPGFCCAHRCQGPGAQNECDWKSSSSRIEEILVNCIWNGWYTNGMGNNYDEKSCFQKNPLPADTVYHQCAINESLPYYCYGADCNCGHYVNMVSCPKYTHVSCGLYVTPEGRFKAVANFTW